jgi:ABC-type Na+ efflux pump permease subunit
MKAVIRKDLLEWFSGGAAGRWGRWEFAVVIGIIGVMLPFMMGRVASQALCGIAAFFPAMMTSMAMADSIAGERERGTLQTLFLLPLSDADILVGKIIGALAYALMLCVGGLAVGTLTLTLLGRSLPPFWEYVAAVFGCFLVSLFFETSVSCLVLGNLTARQAQTYAFMPFYLLVAGTLALSKLHFSVPLLLANPLFVVLLVPIAITLIDAALLGFALQRFRRVRCAA